MFAGVGVGVAWVSSGMRNNEMRLLMSIAANFAMGLKSHGRKKLDESTERSLEAHV